CDRRASTTRLRSWGVPHASCLRFVSTLAERRRACAIHYLIRPDTASEVQSQTLAGHPNAPEKYDAGCSLFTTFVDENRPPGKPCIFSLCGQARALSRMHHRILRGRRRREKRDDAPLRAAPPATSVVDLEHDLLVRLVGRAVFLEFVLTHRFEHRRIEHARRLGEQHFDVAHAAVQLHAEPHFHSAFDVLRFGFRRILGPDLLHRFDVARHRRQQRRRLWLLFFLLGLRLRLGLGLGQRDLRRRLLRQRLRRLERDLLQLLELLRRRPVLRLLALGRTRLGQGLRRRLLQAHRHHRNRRRLAKQAQERPVDTEDEQRQQQLERGGEQRRLPQRQRLLLAIARLGPERTPARET